LDCVGKDNAKLPHFLHLTKHFPSLKNKTAKITLCFSNNEITGLDEPLPWLLQICIPLGLKLFSKTPQGEPRHAEPTETAICSVFIGTARKSLSSGVYFLKI